MAATKCNSATPLIPVPPKSIIFLHEWWLVKQSKGLALGGVASLERGRERLFLSSMIAEREEANVLHTEDGITILFRGFINARRSSQNGLPLEVCQHFLVGFPHDWKKYSDMDGATAFGDSTDNMECECNDNIASLNSSQLQVESQAENRKSTVQPSTLTSPKTMRKEHFSGDRNVKPRIRQKTVLDASNSCNRMVTRSISKRSRTMPKEDEKATISSVISPLRRSPRLYSFAIFR